MNCSQVLPGAVNPGSCSVATGYLDDFPFICYASGSNLIILDGKLHHLQTILGANFGYTDTHITCMDIAESTGKVVAAWGCDVVIFNPEQSDVNLNGKFRWSWKQCHMHTYTSKVLSLSFNRTGTQVLVGGTFICICSLESETESSLQLPDKTEAKKGASNDAVEGHRVWKNIFHTKLPSSVVHLKYSPDGTMFASTAKNDRLVKIWFQANEKLSQQSSKQWRPVKYTFTFITHPRAVTGFAWRKTSAYMKIHAIPNVLLTRCRDNTCRIWSHIVPQEKAPKSNLLRFFVAATIDPISDIPFRSTMPVEDAPFIVHWLNNKEMTFTNKVDRIHRKSMSVQSLTSTSINDEILASWVCVEEKGSPEPEGSVGGDYQTFDIGDYLAPDLPSKSVSPSRDNRFMLTKKRETQLTDEWINSPDLLVCIHPNNGSLMVWTMEGLDSAKHTTKLVHISFSSCLPHVLPPHLAQTLYQELQQYLLVDAIDPEIGTKSPVGLTSKSNLDASVLSLPVPQVRLPMGKRSAAPYIPDSKKQLKTDSSLILLSSHCNGSLNAWSVQLTVQANYCTSIAGLIHCGVTGGHLKEIQSVHRHPWLPVVMTVADLKVSSAVENELIIWNADLAGPLDQMSKIRELSMMTSLEPKSFKYATWVPPIALAGNTTQGALSRCPSFGLFVANVGSELCLFQTSLYPIVPPVTSLSNYYKTVPLYEGSSKEITVFSHSGCNGVSFVSSIEDSLEDYEDIVSLHAFRVDSTVIEYDCEQAEELSNEILIVVIENRQCDSEQAGSAPKSEGCYHSYLHVWRIILANEEVVPLPKRSNSLDPWYQPTNTTQPTLLCHANVTKIHSGPFPITNTNCHIVCSNAACDIASSLQLQSPSLTSPYLFNTVCSDGQLLCWQFLVHVTTPIVTTPTAGGCPKPDQLMLTVYDVFGGSNILKGPMLGLNFSTNEVLRGLPLCSYVPCALSSAYPGRFAVAHHLTRPLPNTTSSNPLDQHGMVSMWECESSGGLQWVCESVLPLHGLGGVASGSKGHENPVLMDWLPMENGAYLLATCFNSVISIFGMALPSEEMHVTQQTEGIFSRRFSKSVSTPVLTSYKASSAWVSLLRFPCSKSFTRLPTLWLTYTGSNSIMVGMGCEIHVYSCWVTKERLSSFSQSKDQRTAAIGAHKHSRLASRLASKDFVNLLDYAHSKNSPLPQYHPKILTDLLNAGKLKAVKMILVNLLKYLLLYQQKKKRTNEFRSFEETVEDESAGESDSRTRLLSMVDGSLTRSKRALLKVKVENIPPVSLSQLNVFNQFTTEESTALHDEEADKGEEDDLFTPNTSSYDSDFLLDEEKQQDTLSFDKIIIEDASFDAEMADHLTSILHYARLPDIDDVEQVRLLAIAHTVAQTKTSFAEQSVYSTRTGNEMIDLGTSTGAGYAASGFVTVGIGGGEAMDDCGLRYLLALQNYITLSASLPKNIATEGLPPSDMIWAFHSDAEMELLSSVPCVQEDRLEWAELRNVGVGWWIRSSDTLRKLAEKLAKAQFMKEKDPLNASLFYIAMKKQSLVKGLFKTVNDDKMTKFFSNDFTQDRWRRAALKNAFALLSKQRFEHAAAFFLLVGQLWDAVEVCLNRLHDFQLALVITRLYEGDGGPTYSKLLKDIILGISQIGSIQNEPSPDPFLRSMSLWLLQDYSGSLETLVVDLKPGLESGGKSSNAAIFNFYFYLRSHPLLIRSKHPVKRGHSVQPSASIMDFTSKFHGQSLSGVGDDPLTPTEHNLVFTTAYYHLNSGSPLLSLIVLSKLPKSQDLDLTDEALVLPGRSTSGGQSLRSASFDAVMSGLITGASALLTTDEQPISFTVRDETESLKTLGAIKEEEEDFDWSKPISMQAPTIEDDGEFDWSKPVSNLADDDDEYDWSKPVSSQLHISSEEDENNLENPSDDNQSENDVQKLPTSRKDPQSKPTSQRGLFIVSLAEQLQYNALLSILTEELTTILIPSSCQYLWESQGKEALPLLPQANDRSLTTSMVEWYEDDTTEYCLRTLQTTLVEWLRNETLVVKDLCGMKIRDGSRGHAGYDLLTTLLNYTSLHAGTLPVLLAIETELMHLMNTLLPWSTGLAQEIEDVDVDNSQMVSCAINPAQLPILTSCSIPVKHPLNLALHIKLLSGSIFDCISEYATPPNVHNPLAQLDRVFELCLSLSHCVSLCLLPMRLQQKRQSCDSMLTASLPPTRRQREGSGSNVLDYLSSFNQPQSKPAKWPGVPNWPDSLMSDDGKEASPLCLVLMEAMIVLYTGLLTVAWSKHTVYDLLVLSANVPSSNEWNALFGGGVSAKKAASSLIQSLRKVHLRKEKKEPKQMTENGLYVAPKKSLLAHCLSKPTNSLPYENFEKEPDDDVSNDDTDDVTDNVTDDANDDVWLDDYDKEEDPNEPNCYSWCLMNLGIVKIISKTLRNTVSVIGMEALEFITASPVLYKLLALLEDWETSFINQLQTHPTGLPSVLQTDGKEQPGYGPAIVRHKFILEEEHSPFKDDTRSSRLAKRLWRFLVHEDSVRDLFINYIFYQKKAGVGAVVDESPVQRILYRQPDSPVSCLCINSGNGCVFALATSKEVLEIDVPDILSLDIMPNIIDEGNPSDTFGTLKRMSLTPTMRGSIDSDEFIMIQQQASSLKRGSLFSSNLPTTGAASSIQLKRNVSNVRRMASHPTLAYYLTGSADGSVRMFEFGTHKPVSTLRQAGSRPGITQIRFTQQGNKYGVTDISGVLSLWQGIQSTSKGPYQTLNPTNKSVISDFAFLGSSSLIATCGESAENKNIMIWDTLMPSRNNVVKEYICHDNGATALAFSTTKQRLISGGQKGELCIFDMRQHKPMTTVVIHSAAVTRIVLNDAEGYFITGSHDGEIKIWDLVTVTELTTIAGKHYKSRLFRPEAGVMDMVVDQFGCLYSCGADGTVKVHTLELPEST